MVLVRVLTLFVVSDVASVFVSDVCFCILYLMLLLYFVSELACSARFARSAFVLVSHGASVVVSDVASVLGSDVASVFCI